MHHHPLNSPALSMPLLVVCVLVVLSLAAGHGMHGATQPSNVRSLHMGGDSSVMWWMSNSTSSGTKNSLRIMVNATDSISIDCAYNRDVSSGNMAQFGMRFMEIIEFDPRSSTNGHFKRGDTVAKRTPMVRGGQTTLTAVKDAGDDQEMAFNGGPMHMSFQMTGRHRDMGAMHYSPGSIKFTMALKDYVPMSTSNRIALRAQITSPTGMSVENAMTTTEDVPGEKELTIGQDGYFAYATTCQDSAGNSVPVSMSDMTPVQQGSERGVELYFTFEKDGMTDMVWDPRLGNAVAGGYHDDRGWTMHDAGSHCVPNVALVLLIATASLCLFF